MPGITTVAQTDSVTLLERAQESTNGAAHVRTTGGTTDYGTYPQNAYLDINGSITAGASQDAYITNDISIYDGVVIDVSAITGTAAALKIFPSSNGVIYSVNPLGIVNLQIPAANTLVTAIDGAAGITAVGVYFIPFPAKFRKLKFSYSVTGTGNLTFTGGIWKR